MDGDPVLGRDELAQAGVTVDVEIFPDQDGWPARLPVGRDEHATVIGPGEAAAPAGLVVRPLPRRRPEGNPGYAAELQGRIAFAWRAMDAFYEKEERILGHAADPYHRIDIRNTSRTLEVRLGDIVIVRSGHPLVLYESGFAPRWYVPRADIDESRLRPVEGQTFCPYKGLCDYYDIGDARRAAWSYRNAYREVDRNSDLVSFEPDRVEVFLDGERLHL